MPLAAGDLDKRITFRRHTRPVGIMKSGQEVWRDVVTVSAEVQDVLPSRAERVAEGVNIGRRPCRIRIRWRDDIVFDSSMRIALDGRELEIVSGPAVIGHKDGFEFMAEELSTSG